MAAWSSSSLSFSEGGTRHKSGLLNNTHERLSKQHIMSKRMFGNKWGSHNKSFQIGKMFKKKGKKDRGGVKSFGTEPHKGIGPSVEEFDNLLDKSTNNKKKSLFSRKQFG